MSEDALAKIQSLMARLSAVESACAGVQRLEAAVAAMDDDFGEPQKRFVSDGAGSISLQYSSFFKLVDVSVGGAMKVGVVDGGDQDSGTCGVVVINGSPVEVDSVVFDVEASGNIYILASITPLAVTAEIVSVETGYVPTAPEGVIAYSHKLIGRVSASGDPISAISLNQDYLAGGEFHVWLYANCEVSAP